MNNVKTSPLEILTALSITEDTWRQAGLEFNSINWVGEAKTTKSEWDAKRLELENAFDAQAYARNRQAEYPDMGSQLNKIYDDGIEKWKTEMVDPIKAKYPK